MAVILHVGGEKEHAHEAHDVLRVGQVRVSKNWRACFFISSISELLISFTRQVGTYPLTGALNELGRNSHKVRPDGELVDRSWNS